MNRRIQRVIRTLTLARQYWRDAYWIGSYVNPNMSDHLNLSKRNPKLARFIRHALVKRVWITENLVDPVVARKERFLNRYFNGPWRIQVDSMRRREFYEYEDRLLHWSFKALVDFVELDLPSDNYDWFTQNKINRKKNVRYPEAGLDQLGKSIDREQFNELRFLYIWWTQVFPTLDHGRLVESADLAEKLTGETEFKKALYELDGVHAAFVHQQKQKMLELLVRSRSGMWT